MRLKYCRGLNVTWDQMVVFVTRAIEKVTAKTPRQITLLKWYEVNQTAQLSSVGLQPWGIAFDGVNIWVAHFGIGSVSKL